MKSVAIKGLKEFELKEIDEPSINGENVVVEVKKAGICGSDIHYWDVGQPVGLVMGHEFCGTVLDPGNRNDLKVGDRVTALPISPCGHCDACLSGNPQYCAETWTRALGLSLTNPGAYAEKTSIRPDMVIKVPKSMTDAEVAMVEPTAVALHAVNLANIKIGDKVLVVGAGIIGTLCATLAKMNGASYVAMSETNEKRGAKSVKLKSADEWFDAKDEKFIENVRSKCADGYDVVIECCGNSTAVSSALLNAKNGGTVVLVGVSLANIEYPSILNVMHELNVKGAIGYTVFEFNDCIELMTKKKIDTLKFVDDIVSLERVQESFERLTSGEDGAIKILIDPKK